MVQWSRVQKDLEEGLKVLREGLETVFSTAEQAHGSWSLRQVQAALREKYEQVGRKVCGLLSAEGEQAKKLGPLKELIREDLEEIGRLEQERERLEKEKQSFDTRRR